MFTKGRTLSVRSFLFGEEEMTLRRHPRIAATIAAAALAAVALFAAAAPATAQTASASSPTQIIVPAFGEVVQPNDQAQATLQVEEQDKDKSAAASRVNQKMNQGIALLRRQDPQAKLRTRGYYTYAVYPEDQPHATNSGAAKPRQPIAWRVGQYLDLTTGNLRGLPQTIAAAQGLMALNGLNFSLSPAAAKQSDAALIDATYKNLTERIASIAHAMGRNPADVLLDTLDFEGSGNYAANEAMPKAMMMRAAAPSQDAVAEPSFEPGETTLNMRAVGKLKFR
jgi:predicted secreted protein